MGIGQVVNFAEGERVAREELLSRALARGDTATVRAVEAIVYSAEKGYRDGLQGFLAHRRLLWMNRMMDYNASAMLQAIAAAWPQSTLRRLRLPRRECTGSSSRDTALRGKSPRLFGISWWKYSRRPPLIVFPEIAQLHNLQAWHLGKAPIVRDQAGASVRESR